MASRPRKRKPPTKNKFPANVESNSGFDDEADVEEHGEQGFVIIRSVRLERF